MNVPHAMKFAALVGAMALGGCSEPAWNGSLEDLLRSQPERFETVMADPAKHRVQIIYTQIDRDAQGVPAFSSYRYRVDPGEYFYPASTVKLPTAALALEKLNRLDVRGLDRDTIMFTEAVTDFQTEVTIDAESPTGLPSVAQYIREILVVSDNDAFNRLYEFIGQEPLNDALAEKGYVGSRIVHRLESPLTAEQQRWTNPVRFENAGSVIHRESDRRSTRDFAAPQPIPLGVAEIIDGERVEGSKDFASKNAYPLQALHDTIVAILFPETLAEGRRFQLTDDDLSFLRFYMSAYPREVSMGRFPDGSYYPDGYVKFLMFGGTEPELPDNIRIFNKVGDAYGFLTDAAYIVDFENNIEFILAATVYTNANQTFNDDEYEYDEIGLPFLRDLGRAIYEIELERERLHVPNLEPLKALR